VPCGRSTRCVAAVRSPFASTRRIHDLLSKCKGKKPLSPKAPRKNKLTRCFEGRNRFLTGCPLGPALSNAHAEPRA
jgi:hypothetical protein